MPGTHLSTGQRSHKRKADSLKKPGLVGKGEEWED